MKESIISVLDMYKEGSLTPDDAKKLIEALWDGGESAALPWEQDNKLRVVAFRGKRLVQRAEAGDHAIDLTLHGEAVSVECWGDITVEGNVGGFVTAGGNAAIKGDVSAGASAGGDLACGGSINGAVTAGGKVDFRTVNGAICEAPAEEELDRMEEEMEAFTRKIRAQAMKSAIEGLKASFGGSIGMNGNGEDEVTLTGGDVSIVALQNGKPVASTAKSTLHVIWDGDTRNLSCELPLTLNGDVAGDAEVLGNVTCGDIGGYLQAAGNVNCGDVGDRIEAGGNVECDDVAGGIKAGGNVECDDVAGNVSAGESVDCGDVSGNVYAKGDISCGSVGGDAKAEGQIN